MRMLVWPVLVVFVLTVVWVGIRAMTVAPPDVNSAIMAIHEDGNTPWRAAILLEALRQPSGAKMRTDPAMARRVAELLEHELDAESGEGSGDNASTVQTYLCRALAQFEVDNGLPVLLRVVEEQNGDAQADERRTAVEALAGLARHIEPARLVAENRRLMPALIDAADSPNPRVRAAAAYALGVFSVDNVSGHETGTEVARTKLQKLLHDAFADVRYNAATGLARSGDAACEAVLLEMLDPRKNIADGSETPRQEMVLLSALAASEQLVENNPGFDVGRIKQAVVSLAEGDAGDAGDADVAAGVRCRAAEILKRW